IAAGVDGPEISAQFRVLLCVGPLGFGESFVSIPLCMFGGFAKLPVSMALACLVCHSMESPSHSFRSYSVSSSDNEGRCSAIIGCLTRKVNFSTETANGMMTSKVAPFPNMSSSGQGASGSPRLIRSLAVSRELVRDWNFDEIALDG
ncbi:hypothetical protein Taro_020875, partial [Colocasia esculenta]|nr:hypothetical protein [Colocasia esculenta]